MGIQKDDEQDLAKFIFWRVTDTGSSVVRFHVYHFKARWGLRKVDTRHHLQFVCFILSYRRQARKTLTRHLF